MENVVFPTETACEPIEEACQPTVQEMAPRLDRQSSRKVITFANGVDVVEKSSSQRSNYKEALSQIPPNLTHRQKLLWLQKRRNSGLWVQCDSCDKWRFLSKVLDRHELPKKWFCRMNPDTSFASCSTPESAINVHDEEDLIHSEYSAGSVVWARLAGWPWWPAMLDDCPDTEQFYWLDGFSDIPTHYNVVFFDSNDVSRAWISPDNLKPYTANKHLFKLPKKDLKFKKRLQAAMKQAEDATKLDLPERLEKYSFLARYPGPIFSPKKINRNDLVKYQKTLKRKFGIDLPMEAMDDVENESEITITPKRNVILLGTPKAVKERRSRLHKINGEKFVVNVNEITVVNDEENPEENHNGTESTDITKQPNSMAVQIGSTGETFGTEAFDNDTSKTYIPEFTPAQSTEPTENQTDPMDFETPAIDSQDNTSGMSPKSDDFDFN